MTKRILFSVVALCLVFSFGCVKPPPATPATPVISATDTTQNAEIAALKTQVATLNSGKAENASLTNAVNRITTLEGQSAANTYTKSQLYTQAQVDALIAALKDDQDWIKGRTSTSAAGTTIGDYGELLDTDGDLELWLERVSGDASDVLLTRKGLNDARFDLVVINLDEGSSHDFKINFMFTPEETVTLAWIGYPVAANVTGTYCALGNCPLDDSLTEISGTGGLIFSMSRAGDNYLSRNPLVAYQTNTERILKGEVEDYTVFLDVLQGSDKRVEWEWDITIKDKD